LLDKQTRGKRRPTLRFRADAKHFKNGAFRKLCRQDINVIFLAEFSSNTNLQWPVIVTFPNVFGMDGKIWMNFQSESAVFEFLGRGSLDGAWGGTTNQAQTFFNYGRKPDVYVLALSTFSCPTNELQSSHFSIYNLKLICNEKGAVRVEREKARLPVNIPGSKTAVLNETFLKPKF